jgi:hypothetical protein
MTDLGTIQKTIITKNDAPTLPLFIHEDETMAMHESLALVSKSEPMLEEAQLDKIVVAEYLHTTAALKKEYRKNKETCVLMLTENDAYALIECFNLIDWCYTQALLDIEHTKWYTPEKRHTLAVLTGRLDAIAGACEFLAADMDRIMSLASNQPKTFKKKEKKSATP